MIEFDVDMGYLLEEDELDRVVLNDENGEHEPMEFVPKIGRGTCHTVGMDCFGNHPYNQSGLSGNSTAVGCSKCGCPWSTMGVFRGNKQSHNFKACPICGRRVVG